MLGDTRAEVVRREYAVVLAREHVAVVEAPERARVPPARARPPEVEEGGVEALPSVEPPAVVRLRRHAHHDGRDAAEDEAEAPEECVQLWAARAVLVLAERHQNGEPRGRTLDRAIGRADGPRCGSLLHARAPCL